MGLFSKKSSGKGGSKPPSASKFSFASKSLAFARTENPQHSLQSNGSEKSPQTPTRSSMSSLYEILENELPKPPDPAARPADYLRSINAVRERSNVLVEQATRTGFNHFVLDLSKLDETAQYVCSIIKRDYASEYGSIPSYVRLGKLHVNDDIDSLMALWGPEIDDLEKTRRLLDFNLVSALLDAFADRVSEWKSLADRAVEWKYQTQDGKLHHRGAGLAIACVDMFKRGMFSGDLSQPFKVDGSALKNITRDDMADALQVGQNNKMECLHDLTNIINNVGDALKLNLRYFGEDGRPGCMIDYILNHRTTLASSVPIVYIYLLWEIIIDGLSFSWTTHKTQIDGIAIGDAYMGSLMPSHPTHPWLSVVPFHEFTQSLAYSLMSPMQKYLKIHFVGTRLLTGLPDYRSGGLLIDSGVLTLKDADVARGLAHYEANSKIVGQPNEEVVPMFQIDDDVVVEWRALTVHLLDKLWEQVNLMLELEEADHLGMAQLMEAGTRKGGCEIAEVSRPNTKKPPILVATDGTLF